MEGLILVHTLLTTHLNDNYILEPNSILVYLPSVPLALTQLLTLTLLSNVTLRNIFQSIISHPSATFYHDLPRSATFSRA